MEEQAKQLGNAYLPGARAALHGYTQLFADEEGHVRRRSRPRRASASTARRSTSSAGCTRSSSRAGPTCTKRLDDPDLAVRPTPPSPPGSATPGSSRELKACGLVETDAELVQLAFNSHDDVARQEYVDTGVWMTLGNGRIRVTQTLRPYKAAKYIKSDDSFFQVAQVKELCVYPGGVNPRVRWDGMVAAAAGAEGPGDDPRPRPGRLRRRGQGGEDDAQGPAGRQARRSWR